MTRKSNKKVVKTIVKKSKSKKKVELNKKKQVKQNKNRETMSTKKLEISELDAIKYYPSAPDEFKAVLEQTFGKDFFISKNIMDRVKNFEDAFLLNGQVDASIAILLNYNGINKDMLAAVASVKLSIVCSVLNEGWVPDWDNSSEYKYYPYFDMRKSAVDSSGRSGFGFWHTLCDYSRAFTTGGSRLCFKSRALAEYAGKQFDLLYRELNGK